MKIHNHVVLTMVIVLISVGLLVVSVSLPSSNKLSAILQGLSTGLLAGVLLLFISGIKNKERSKLQAHLNSIQKCRTVLLDIESAYNELYNGTYLNKNDTISFEAYYDDLRFAIMYFDMLSEEWQLKKTFSEPTIGSSLRKAHQGLLDVEMMLKRAMQIYIDNPDRAKAKLNEVENRIYKISSKMVDLGKNLIIIETEVYREMEHLNNSLI